MNTSYKIGRYKHDGDFSYALGMTLTMELLLRAPEYAEKVFISTNADDNEALRQLKNLCEKNDLPLEVNSKAFNILSPKGNCFVIGVFRKYDCVLSEGSHIVLVNPSDAGNLGTIIRTAVGFGLPNLAAVRPAADIFDPKTVRASMGALFNLKFVYFDSFDEYREKFPGNFLYPFTLRPDSVPLNQISFREPFSLIFGNEATGLPDGFAEMEDGKGQAVIIPHSGLIDSLNLPVAAAIGMYSAVNNYPRSRSEGQEK